MKLKDKIAIVTGGGQGIGRGIARLWCGLEHPKDLPEVLGHLEGKPILTRSYRIVADGQPLMLINEQFPFDESTTRKSSSHKQT